MSVSAQTASVSDISGQVTQTAYRYHTLSVDATGTLVVRSSDVGEFDANDPDAEPITQVTEPSHETGEAFLGTAFQVEGAVERVFDGRYVLDGVPNSVITQGEGSGLTAEFVEPQGKGSGLDADTLRGNTPTNIRSPIYGTGEDGAVELTSGSIPTVVNATTFEIPSGTVDVDGVTVIRATESITISGELNATGAGSSGGSGGDESDGSQGGEGLLSPIGAGGSGGSGDAGGSGGSGGDGDLRDVVLLREQLNPFPLDLVNDGAGIGAGGGGGGGGQTFSDGTDGEDGDSPGGGGGGTGREDSDSGQNGGDGGDGGGLIILRAPSVTISGTLRADGTDGESPGDSQTDPAGGGGGGGSGGGVLIYTSDYSNTGTISAAPGSGGSGGFSGSLTPTRNGGDGADGSAGVVKVVKL